MYKWLKKPVFRLGTNIGKTQKKPVLKPMQRFHALDDAKRSLLPRHTQGKQQNATKALTNSVLSWDDYTGTIGTASSVKAETVGGKSFLHFQLLHPHPGAQPAARTLVLRGPGKAVLALHARLLKRCIAALDACCCWLPASVVTDSDQHDEEEGALNGGRGGSGGGGGACDGRPALKQFAYNPLSAFIPTQAGGDDEV